MVHNMKNPLRKRYPRELKSNLAKYFVVFAFIVVTIGFVSGFLVADSSMILSYRDSFDRNHIEDGHFILSQKLSKELSREIEKEQNVELYENFYVEYENEEKHTYRIYKNREKVNLVEVHEGEIPHKEGEIAVDRMYAENIGLSVGDEVRLEGETYRISGLIACSDYTSLFKKNTDMMFDATKFTVAIVCEAAFENLDEKRIQYDYAWTYEDENLSENEKYDRGTDLASAVLEKGYSHGISMEDFVRQEDNQAIHFAGDDMGSDKIMIQVILCILLVLIAFIFAVTSINTIEQDAKTIGTLRASGYSKWELVMHYMVLPVAVTFLGVMIGNVLGYTVFKDLCASMYYGSYSLPPYKTVWSTEAFLFTSVSTVGIMIVVNMWMLGRKLSISPLKFLRNDLSKKKNKKAVKLPHFGFLSRFRIRVILQNKGSYLILLLGIVMANFMLMFGLFFEPMLEHYTEEILDSKICSYQYVLRMPYEVEDEGAEKYALTVLEDKKYEEEINVFGVESNSDYIKGIDGDEGMVYMSEGYMKKYNYHEGDKITCKELHQDKEYTFEIKQSYDYAGSLSIFMPIDNFRKVFAWEEEVYTGYFSREELSQIPKENIASLIDEKELTVLSDQMHVSLGSLMNIWSMFAVALFLLVIFILSKMVIEKNSNAISMLKILGFTPRESAKVYSHATTVVVVFSILISLPLNQWMLRRIWEEMMVEKMKGYVEIYVAPQVYPKMILIGLAAYVVISFIIGKKIEKIPKSEALKNAE